MKWITYQRHAVSNCIQNSVQRAYQYTTVKPVYNDHLMGLFYEFQKAEIVSKSKLVRSIFIKTHY